MPCVYSKVGKQVASFFIYHSFSNIVFLWFKKSYFYFFFFVGFKIVAAKEEDDSGRSSWSDNQSHASHSTQASSGCHSSPAEFHWDESSKWPTSFWTQFKVSLHNF